MDTPEEVLPDDLGSLPTFWFRRRRRGKVRRAVSAIFGGAAVYSLAAVLLLPPVLFLGAGVWSVVTYARTLVTLWNQFISGQLQTFLDGLGGVDLPVRLAMASGAFFALLFALIVIFAGLLGRGWRWLLLLPGLLLGVPALVIFLTGAQAAASALYAAQAFPEFLAPLATAYALIDLVVLAAFLTDLRPRLPRRRRTRRSEQVAQALPLVRFGPPSAFVVARVDAPEEDAVETSLDNPTDPRMTASVSAALHPALPVALLPIAAAQHDVKPAVPDATHAAPEQDDEAPHRDAAEVSE